MSKKKQRDFSVQYQEQALLQILSEAIPVPIFYKDANLKYIGCNQAFEKFFGKKREAFIGKTAFELLDTFSQTAKIIERDDLDFLSSSKDHCVYERIFNDCEGQGHHFVITAAKFYNADGQLGGIVSVMFDNTEREQAEKKLLEERNLLQTMIDAMPTPIFYKDTNYRYIGCNRYFEIFTQTQRSKIIGKTVFDIFSLQRAQPIHENESQFMTSPNDQIVYEATYPNGLGEIRNYLVTKAKFYHPDQSVAGMVVITTDITKQKDFEKGLQQSKEEAESLYQNLLQKNEQLTSSILYASRIQQSILLNPKEIAENFEDFFIFFRPKDIVSGDFYWFARKGDFLILAAVDCTGHGIPGALMTVLGNELLNQIVLEQDVLRPDTILFTLDLKLRLALQKRTQEVNDGMEMGVCVIDFRNHTLQFAGAKTPLYLCRQGQLEQIAASKFSIGGYPASKDKLFKLHTQKILENDVFYLFTDGFQDQMNGLQKQKFMVKNLKELLIQIHHLPLREQRKKLETTFNTWRGTQLQTDDVLAIGFRVDSSVL